MRIKLLPNRVARQTFDNVQCFAAWVDDKKHLICTCIPCNYFKVSWCYYCSRQPRNKALSECAHQTHNYAHQPLARAPCMYRAAQLCSLSKQLFYLYVCACTPFVCSSTSVMGYTNLASPPHPIWSCQAWQRSESKSGHSMHRQSYQWDMKCAVLGATNGLDLIRLNSERHHLHSHVGPLKGTLTTSYTKQKRKFVKSHMCIHGKNCLNCWYYKKCMHTELQHKLKTKVTTTIKVIIVLLSYN